MRQGGGRIALPGEEPFEGAAEVVWEMIAEGRDVEMGSPTPQIPAEDYLSEKVIGSLAERQAQ